VLRGGADLTCAAAGGMVRKALAAADRLAGEDIAVEVIDLRCIMPLDQTTIIASVARTGRILALDEGPRGGGLAAEVLALVAESDVMRGRSSAMQRLTAAPAPIAYAPHLAAAAVPDGNAVERVMRDMVVRDMATGRQS
jgi:pyruvate/2-oxoglutarate/acetoin dehydrogenase E1 component